MDIKTNKIIAKNQIMCMYIFVSVVYFISYLTRVNYSTILIEISSAEEISRSLLALPLTASFITYGLGQILSGWLGDRFDAFKLISFGIVLSALMNALLPLFPKPYVMTAFWAINGLAQAMIYPPLMKITSHYLSQKNYGKACLFVTSGGHIATLLLYLLAPLLIAVWGWRMVFAFSVTCAVIFLVAWQFYARSIRKKYGAPTATVPRVENETNEKTERPSVAVLLISSGLIIVMIAVVMMGFLRDGIATWMPAYLKDVFTLSNEISILTTVILPIFSILSAYVIQAIRERFCRNELKLAGLTFLTALIAIVLLLLFRNNMPLSVLFLATVSGCSHAINFLLICLVPIRFEKSGHFTLVTGMINSCTYVGAALSTYGFAAVSESYGWNVTLILWAVIALVGLLCCFGALLKWNKFQN